MNVKTWLAASALLLAGPALAEEPLNKVGTEPSMQSAPQTTGPADNEPLNKTATEPEMKSAPQATEMSPGKEPLEQMGAQPSTNAPSQAAAGAPAEVVITELTETQDGKKMVQPWGLPAERVAEMDVYDAKGKKIGQVNAVLQDKNGEVKGIAVGYGGFLGFGEKGAILTLDRVKLKDGTIVTEISEDQLSQQPEWPHKK
jgi:sporulation protein YlmC with PRC-barrel domain